MENSRVQYGSSRKRINLGNIIGDPFALATISIAAVSAHTYLADSSILARFENQLDGTKVTMKLQWS